MGGWLLLCIWLVATVGSETGCPKDNVPWPSTTGQTQSCQPVAQASEECLAFLRKHMPPWDVLNAASLIDGGIIEPTVNLSLTARMSYPWASLPPRQLFNEYVLPYASVNEARTDWRGLLWERLSPLVRNSTAQSPLQVLQVLNKQMWTALGGIHFKSEQTPLIYDPMSTIVFGYASCTGVSLLLIDALRTFGVAARLVGTPAWGGNVSNGNHNWVEVWLGQEEGWVFGEAGPAGPGESFDNPCDKWFCNPGKFKNTSTYAAKWSWTDSSTHYPMAWDLQNKAIPGEQRTDFYDTACSKCGIVENPQAKKSV